jgi:hypothetical protein
VQVYALTGGLPPIMPTLDPSSLKRRQIPSKKVQMPSLRSLHLTAEVYNEHQTKKPSGWDSWPHCMLLGVVSTTTCRRCSPWWLAKSVIQSARNPKESRDKHIAPVNAVRICVPLGNRIEHPAVRKAWWLPGFFSIPDFWAPIFNGRISEIQWP